MGHLPDRSVRSVSVERVVSAGLPLSVGHESAEALGRLLASVDAVDQQERVLARLVSLAIAWTGAQGAAISVPTSGPGPPERLVVHSGMPTHALERHLDPHVRGTPPSDEQLLSRPISLAEGGLGYMTVAWPSRPPGEGPMWFDPVVAVDALSLATGLILDSALRRKRSHHREQWLSAVVDICQRLASGEPATKTLHTVGELARRPTGADYAWIMVAKPDDEFTLPVLLGLTAQEEVLVARNDLRATMSALVIRTNVQRVVLGTEQSPGGIPVRPLVWLGPTLLLPAATGAGVEGMLGLAWSPTRVDDLQALDEALSNSLSELTALAIRLSRVEEASATLASLQDRNRIARDLHDRVIQRLYGIGLSLSAAQSGTQPATEEVVIDVIDDLDDTITEIRRTISDLAEPLRDGR